MKSVQYCIMKGKQAETETKPTSHITRNVKGLGAARLEQLTIRHANQTPHRLRYSNSDLTA